MSAQSTNPNAPARYDFPLPSGAIAQILRKPKARHMRNGQRVAGKDGSMVNYAIMAEVCLINGLQLTAEDMMDLDMADGIVLLGEVFSPDGKPGVEGDAGKDESSGPVTSSH